MDDFLQTHALRLRYNQPYLAGLCLMTVFRQAEACLAPTTNGAEILYCPDFFEGFSDEVQRSFLVRPLLHLVLQHPARCQQDARLRLAAELVVNRLLSVELGLELPPGALRAPEGESGGAEEVAARLRGGLPFCEAFPALAPAPSNLALLHSTAQRFEASLSSARKSLPWLLRAGLSVAEVDAPTPLSWASSLQRVCSGQGAQTDLPADLVEQFLWMQWLGESISEIEPAVAAFHYVVQHASAAMVPLFGNRLMISMRAKSLQGVMALRIQREPLLKQYLTKYQVMLGLNGAR